MTKVSGRQKIAVKTTNFVSIFIKIKSKKSLKNNTKRFI
ncbi:hypothetical protein A45J_0523 [hot springs metagenome]|uniref:Uncharacterized protein n=1 Tax=hot springs metagenome TaxID=433727 RepID=A0A5J4L211_9ZZZZ